MPAQPKAARGSSCRNLLLGELWGKLANSRQQPGRPNPIFQNAGQSKQLITANDLQNWSVALGAKADSVPKTEHKLQESCIIASRHGKLSRTSLRLATSST